MKVHRVVAAVLILLAPSGSVQAFADATDTTTEARTARAAAAQALGSMDTAAAHVRAQLRYARMRGVADEIACVSDGLSRVDVTTRHAREDAVVLQDAYARGAVNEARRAWNRVVRARDEVRRASATADGCVAGDDVTTPGGTQVRVVIDPQIANEAR